MADKITWRSNAYREMVCKTVEQGVEIILFDTETTGLSPQKDRIIEIAAIKYVVDETCSLREIDCLHQYIRPPFLISQTIIDLTGITNEKLADYPYEGNCFDRVYKFFGNTPYIISGHNVGFDERFLKALYERNYGGSLEPYHVLDTLEMARDRVKPSDTENYKLGTLAHLFGLDEGVEFHSAIEDVKVTAKLFELFLKEYRDEPEVNDTENKITANVTSVNFWEGYQGFSRIYVETNVGSVYYDIRRKTWSPKDADIRSIDMESLEKDVLAITHSEDTIQFAKFKGRIKV